MSHDNNSRLVYSTDGGMIKESAPTQSASPFPADGVVRIRRETKGRKGAGVITIHGVPAEQQKTIATLLKKKCGTGGGGESWTRIRPGASRLRISRKASDGPVPPPRHARARACLRQAAPVDPRLHCGGP